jgi:hypothetical protein
VAFQDLREDFNFLKKRRDILGVLLFGSHARGEATPRSDVDICIVAPKANGEKLLGEVLQRVPAKSKNYQIWLFEELPLYIKKEVIKSHKIIICEDKPSLYEYFYFVNKLWRDQEHRQKVTKEEIKEMFAGG